MTGNVTLTAKELRPLCISALKTILEGRSQVVHDKVVYFQTKYNQDIEKQNRKLFRRVLGLKSKSKINFQDACDIMDQKHQESKSDWDYYDDRYLRKSGYKVALEKTLNQLLAITDENEDGNISIDLETIGDICRLKQGIYI